MTATPGIKHPVVELQRGGIQSPGAGDGNDAVVNGKALHQSRHRNAEVGLCLQCAAFLNGVAGNDGAVLLALRCFEGVGHVGFVVSGAIEFAHVELVAVRKAESGAVVDLDFLQAGDAVARLGGKDGCKVVAQQGAVAGDIDVPGRLRSRRRRGPFRARRRDPAAGACGDRCP